MYADKSHSDTISQLSRFATSTGTNAKLSMLLIFYDFMDKMPSKWTIWSQSPLLLFQKLVDTSDATQRHFLSDCFVTIAFKCTSNAIFL